MHRLAFASAAAVAALLVTPAFAADPPAPLPQLPASAPTPTPTPASAPASTPASAQNGIAVVALSGATDAAWPLATSVYASAELRPFGVDEAHARVLCGEAPAAGAPAELRDLADTVAAVRGEDAASRALLADIARRLNVRALAVVRTEGERTSMHLFVADGAAFDAATYGPDPGTSGATGTWSATTRSLARAFGTPASPPGAGPATPGPSAPALATHAEPAVTNEPPKPKAFYETGWFWGALGAAAFAGGAVFFATRDNGPTTIHLDMQVPH